MSGATKSPVADSGTCPATFRGALLHQGLRLESLTIIRNVIEAVIAVGAGWLGPGVALVGFGLDSVIETIAGVVLYRRSGAELRGTSREVAEAHECKALWVVGITFLLLGAYILYEAGAMLRKVGVREGMDVVDLCCGDGYFTAPWARLVGDGRVYAVDMLEEMLRQARAEVERTGSSKVTFIRGDARRLAQLVGQPVDVVLMANTFHGVDDQTGLATGVQQVLQPGGRFVIVNWYPLPREKTPVLGKPRGPREELRMAPEAVRAVVEPAGLFEVEVADVGPYHYASIFEHPVDH